MFSSVNFVSMESKTPNLSYPYANCITIRNKHMYYLVRKLFSDANRSFFNIDFGPRTKKSQNEEDSVFSEILPSLPIYFGNFNPIAFNMPKTVARILFDFPLLHHIDVQFTKSRVDDCSKAKSLFHRAYQI